MQPFVIVLRAPQSIRYLERERSSTSSRHAFAEPLLVFAIGVAIDVFRGEIAADRALCGKRGGRYRSISYGAVDGHSRPCEECYALED